MHELDSSQLLQIGTGGVLALIILKTVFDFLRVRNEKDRIEIDRHLEKALDKLAENIEKQTEVLTDIKIKSDQSTQVVRSLSSDIKEMRQTIFNNYIRSTK